MSTRITAAASAKAVSIILLATLGVTAAYMTVLAPLMISHSVAASRESHRRLLAAAQLVEDDLQISSRTGQQQLADRVGLPNLLLTEGASRTFEEPCPSFSGAEGDRFIISTWRGEVDDCLAYPSRRHTFGISPMDYVFGSVGVIALIAGSAAALCLFGIVRLLRGPTTTSR